MNMWIICLFKEVMLLEHHKAELVDILVMFQDQLIIHLTIQDINNNIQDTNQDIVNQDMDIDIYEFYNIIKIIYIEAVFIGSIY